MNAEEFMLELTLILSRLRHTAMEKIRRVEALHSPSSTDPYICGGCWQSYPCTTIQALEGNEKK